ncbi:TIGR03936 family radical SAM-associated protein [Wukongibacter baidiensis]|uniref:TIGR03936 family radical SAM-associated protein n=1 Tax=Wukongibacter baidiensis TaxID=1723361 RepID=UPI003D7F353E
MFKMLVKFTKQDRMKFLSHLELIKLVERAFRRASVPLKFSQGFNPHPKIAFAAPLAVGVSSEGEYLTVELDEKLDTKEFVDNLNNVLPEGIKFLKAKYIDNKSKSLMSIVEDATYIIKCRLKKNYSLEELNDFIKKFLSRNEISHEKRGKRGKVKTVDIRSLIKEIIALSLDGNEIIFKMTVSTGSQGNLKPEIAIQKLALLENVEIETESIRVHRIEIFSSEGNKKLVPIDAII